MTNSHGPSKIFKNKILEECKKLTIEGKVIEATHLFKVYFPKDNFVNIDKIVI
jgi:hypothetical protein